VATPAQVGASGGLSTITGLVTGTGVAAVVVLDSSVPQKSVGVTISCDPTTGGAITSALIVTPGFDYASSTCVGQTSSFAITGGPPPYRVNWSGFHNAGSTISNQAGYSAPPSALPVPVANSGEGFYVTGLLDLVAGGALTSFIAISDSGVPTPQQAVRSITCP
jgi:hypothetical protein